MGLCHTSAHALHKDTCKEREMRHHIIMRHKLDMISLIGTSPLNGVREAEGLSLAHSAEEGVRVSSAFELIASADEIGVGAVVVAMPGVDGGGKGQQDGYSETPKNGSLGRRKED